MALCREPTEAVAETKSFCPCHRTGENTGFRRFSFFMCCMVLVFTLVRTLVFLIWFYPFSIVPIPSSTQNAPGFAFFLAESGAFSSFLLFFLVQNFRAGFCASCRIVVTS